MLCPHRAQRLGRTAGDKAPDWRPQILPAAGAD
jgi:hypothetical protein